MQVIQLPFNSAAEIKLVQEANATGWEEIRKVFSSDKGVDNLVILEILKSQNEIAKSLSVGDSQKIYLPNDVAGFFGAIGGMKELLAAKDRIKSDLNN